MITYKFFEVTFFTFDRASGWQIDPQMNIDSVQTTINGNLIKRLNPFECDMMYITQKELHACKDNFR